MMAPRYQEIPEADSPTIERDGVWARVIAGECLGVTSSIDTVIPISLDSCENGGRGSIESNYTLRSEWDDLRI